MRPKFFVGGIALVLVVALNLAPATAQDAAHPGSLKHLPMQPYRNADGSFMRFRGEITTQSWSGYAMTAAAPYTSASATWQVPDVSYDGGTTPYGYEYVLNWVGIGGYGDSTLIQLGTEEMVSTSGTRTFYTWYELYPALSQSAGLTVKPGDIVTASLQCTAACSPSQTQTWQLIISDDTSGAAWTQSFQYQSSMASAEWIVEPPYYNPPGFLPLADYGQVTYDPVEANGMNPNLSLSANGIIMEGSYGQTSNPSAPVSGDVFSLCWGSGSLTPCTAGSFTTPPPAATASLTASPKSITTGQSSTLSWSSTNAISCTGGGFTASGTSGSAVVFPTVTTSYSVACSNGEDPATAMATVTVSSTTGGTGGHGKKH
jgi:hypothetical protein